MDIINRDDSTQLFSCSAVQFTQQIQSILHFNKREGLSEVGLNTIWVDDYDISDKLSMMLVTIYKTHSSPSRRDCVFPLNIYLPYYPNRDY